MGHDQFHDTLEKIYLDWVNNFLTIEAFAAAYGITEAAASAIIEAGRLGSIWK
jgi:hypothetical protein